MRPQVGILVAEDDEGHFALIRRNLKRAGVGGPVLRFSDGQEILDFLYDRVYGSEQADGQAFVLLLDIRMPKVDGIEVLRRLRADPILRCLPVVILTTTDDPTEVDRCYQAGAGLYVVKPIQYDRFVETIRRIGLFIATVCVPSLRPATDGAGGGR